MDILRKYLLSGVARAPEAEVGSDAAPPDAVISLPADAPKSMSMLEAARSLRKAREKEQEPEQRREAAAEPQESEPAVAGDDTGESEAPPGEAEGADAEVNLPPIEPPRSWTKEDKELFAGLPRETQERLAERERSRDTDISRRQQEATEKLKGLTAKEQEVEQARQQYENVILPQALAMLQGQQASEFSDIKTMADLDRLAVEDVGRFNRFQVHRMNLANTMAELQQAQQRQAQKQQQDFAEFAEREGTKFLELVPEMADPAKAKVFQESAVATLKATGFKEGELADAWQGKANVPFRDARVQAIIHKAALWDEAQKKAKAANVKPVPPVQRPGTAPVKGQEQQARVQNLTKKLDTSGSLKDAAALLRARRAAR